HRSARSSTRLTYTTLFRSYGSYDLILPEDRQLFAYTRTLGDQRLLCVVNLSDEPAACEVPEEFAAAQKLIEVGQPSISGGRAERSEEHTSELQSRFDHVCR